MKLYFAGAENHIDIISKYSNNILIAYPFIKKRPILFNPNYFLDSGAFTAYNTKKTIDIDEYIGFIKTNRIKIYAGLDVIGDGEKTKNNIYYMVKKGLAPIPTFHYGVDFKILQEYSKKFNYIALGGLVPIKNQTNNLEKWLKKVFQIIKNNNKLHAFGLNNYNIMLTFPFYSVDATSWHNPERWGQHFKFKDGQLKRFDGRKKSFFRFYKREKQIENSIAEFISAEKYITDLWIKRGVVWDE